jgi:hypothetical protein
MSNNPNRRVTIAMDADLVSLVNDLGAQHPYAPRHQLLRAALRRGLRTAIADAELCRRWLAEDAREVEPLVAG